MTKEDQLTEIYLEIMNSDKLIKSMMSMKKLFDFLKNIDFGKDDNHKNKSILDSINDTNSYIIAKFNDGDVEFRKKLLKQRFAGLAEYVK